ncbi:M67 family metallopeptidase [uncultured Thalassospira sp.]|jgi:proteasome lid subunit RPN8/RPN11|uniref:M67 family metallopeptidase n=1 Tax=uncultured Thalassospira sp. TaxID=404382 RepID=UPI0030D72E02|tara:strand:+ start:15211 stop:15687 length:477 start_codon:yes stop_codon:yes gene_type:complete
MMDSDIILPQQVLGEILDHAAQSWPMECCGLLISDAGLPPVATSDNGPGRVISRIVVAQNVASDPAMTFEIDPGLLLRTHRAVRDAGEDIIGCYHSHPDGRILPSRTDLARAEQPGFYWLIVGSQANDTRDWALYQRVPLHHDPAIARSFRRCDYKLV